MRPIFSFYSVGEEVCVFFVTLVTSRPVLTACPARLLGIFLRLTNFNYSGGGKKQHSPYLCTVKDCVRERCVRRRVRRCDNKL